MVAIVVDQLAAWMAAERFPTLPPDGGFARLLREGTYVRELRFQHAVTETAPGHAALFTGKPPRQTGIYSNEVFRKGAAEPVSILLDSSSRLVRPDGTVASAEGSSISPLSPGVPTVADVLRAVRPDARIVSLSLKDRGAIFGGGRHPDLVLWLDTKGGTFVSSTAFPSATRMPPWVAAAGGAGAMAAARTIGWTLSPDEERWVRVHAYASDEHPGEATAPLGNRFPHSVTSAEALRATPAGDELVLALARAALKELPSTGVPVLLSLSLSANDYVNHLFGPQSWEAWDELLRLDAALGRFFADLDRAVGTDGWAVLVTGDHGGNVLPELAGTERGWCSSGARPGGDLWERPCDTTRRMLPRPLRGTKHDDGSTVAGLLETALARELGGTGPWIATVAAPFVYLAPGRNPSGEDRRRIADIAAAALRPFDVSAVRDARVFSDGCEASSAGADDDLLCQSLPRGLPADLVIVPRHGDFFDARLDPGRGTNHGSPRLYDRAVPLLVRAPGHAAPGAVVAEPVRFDAFTRSLASLLGLPRDRIAADARDLVTSR